MKRCVLIFACCLLLITLYQKWPTQPHTLSPSLSKISCPILETFTDPESGLHCFFHSHRAGELGHFHIFFTDEDQSVSHHIVGASIGGDGRLIKLFVTAPWVTNELQLKSDEIVKRIEALQPDSWVASLLKKHIKDIEELHTFKDQLKKPKIGRYEIIAEKEMQSFPHALSGEIDQKDARF